MDKKRKKYYLIMGGVIISFILMFAFLSSSDRNNNGGFIIDKNAKNAPNYDDKLKAAKERSKSQSTDDFQMPTDGYFQADSVLENGELIENPTIVKKREQEAAQQRQIKDLSDNFQSASLQLTNAVRGDVKQQDFYDETTPRPRSISAKSLYREKAMQEQAAQQPKSIKKEIPQQEPLSDKEKRRLSYSQGFGNSTSTTLQCVVHKTQEIANGSMVSLRVVENAHFSNLTLPKNTVVYAILRVNNNRALLSISSFKLNGRIYSAAFSGYGDDGVEGLPLALNQVNKEVGNEVGSAVVNELNNIVGAIGGGVGRTATSIARSAMQGKKREEDKKIRLIDNQRITFIQNQ